MKIFSKISEYKSWYSAFKTPDTTIGFVPTMGALHAGHLSLIKTSKKENDITICSIYVNPTQFNDMRDYENYPRVLEDDINKLERCSCDILFKPESDEMYPPNGEADASVNLDLGSLVDVMEGQFRPGHFDGVMTIVERFFRIIKPDRAYFGQKDYQQLTVIKRMKEQLRLTIDIIGCPTVREEDGLALSSRNLLLSSEQRAEAPAIFRSLTKGKEQRIKFDVEHVKRCVQEEIDQLPNLKVEYIEIADSRSLQPIDSWRSTDSAVCCVAVYAGDVRLIDNIILYN